MLNIDSAVSIRADHQSCWIRLELISNSSWGWSTTCNKDWLINQCVFLLNVPAYLSRAYRFNMDFLIDISSLPTSLALINYWLSLSDLSSRSSLTVRWERSWDFHDAFDTIKQYIRFVFSRKSSVLYYTWRNPWSGVERTSLVDLRTPIMSRSAPVSGTCTHLSW